MGNNSKKYLKYVYSMHQTMLTKDLYLVFEGEFSQEIVKSILFLTERNLDYYDENLSVKKKIFNIMVECLQNICRNCYEEENISTLKCAISMIWAQTNNYTILSGNFMPKKEVASLKSQIEKINGLDKIGLKDLYKEIMIEDKRSSKGGAGLGLVVMARKSGQKFHYHFQDVEENVAFFSLQTIISK